MTKELTKNDYVPIDISLKSPSTGVYIAHATLMTIKLLCCNPVLWRITSWIKSRSFPDTDIVRRAYLTELKCLVPFWVSGALYITLNPSLRLTRNMFRTFSIARCVVFMGYYINTRGSRAISNLPDFCADVAGIVSYIITIYMTVCVITYYINFL